MHDNVFESFMGETYEDILILLDENGAGANFGGYSFALDGNSEPTSGHVQVIEGIEIGGVPAFVIQGLDLLLTDVGTAIGTNSFADDLAIWTAQFSGNDVMEFSQFNDTMRGFDGNDTMKGHDGADTLSGDGGNDKLVGGNGEDTLNGDSGNDRLSGGNGKDTLNGGDDDDTLIGGKGSDRLDGGDGVDELYGGKGKDKLLGGNDADVMFGEAGNDKIYGGSGKDLIVGGEGNDILRGDGGGDTFAFEDGFGTDTVLDFNVSSNTEKLDLSAVSGIIDFDDLNDNHLTNDINGDAVITVGANTVTLIGVDEATLTVDDFIF